MKGDKIFGINPVIEALRSGRRIERLLLVRERRTDRHAAEIIRLAEGRNIKVSFVSRGELDRTAGGVVHQGVAAFASSRGYASLDDILARPSEKNEPGLFLVLDGVEDPRNLGAIIRTAEAAGVHGVVIPERRSAGLSEAAVKAAAGAVEYLPVARVVNISRALEEFKKAGVWVVGAEAGAGRVFWDADFSVPSAIVVGGEGKGTRRLVLEKCDYIVSLPLMGKISSLNVSVAAGVLLYEALRQRGVGRSGKAGNF
mgnify:CR=1 FL=1